MQFLKRFAGEIARLVLFAAVLGAVGASGQVYKWSQTPGTNATADPHINWAEGQAPSSINDSSRAEMAELAKYRDDISGALTTGGSSTAYTVTTNQGFPTIPTDGQLLAITPHATNGVASTIVADGGTAYAIQSSPGVAVGAAALVQGTPYTLKFSLSNTAWILRDFYGNPYAIPLGGMMPYTGATAPNSNFVLAYGQCISRTTYATYFAQVSTTFGACDGTTTFAVPDLRGTVVAGVDNMGGVSGGRFPGLNTGTFQGAVTHTILAANLPPHTHSGTTGNDSPDHTHNMGANVTSASVPQSSPTVAVIKTDAISGAGFSAQTGGASVRHQHPFTTDGGTGSSSPFTTVQPTLGLNMILRII